MSSCLHDEDVWDFNLQLIAPNKIDKIGLNGLLLGACMATHGQWRVQGIQNLPKGDGETNNANLYVHCAVCYCHESSHEVKVRACMSTFNR